MNKTSCIVKCTPTTKEIVLRFRGLIQFNKIKKLRKKIKQYKEKDVENYSEWKRKLKKLSNYGEKYSEFIEEFINIEIHIEKESKYLSQNEDDNAIVVCVVKNDLMRIKLFLEYYRNLGVKSFLILDDSSDDGTKEFLLDQDDVTVFSSSKGYTTVRRQVWINKMIAISGINKWYLVVDSDELLTYEDCESYKIKYLIKYLNRQKLTRVKAVLLDMLCKDGLYSGSINEYSDIPSNYNLFSNKFYTEDTMYCECIKGGVRESLFYSKNTGKYNNIPVVSKYPLIFVTANDILINSHYSYPFKKNYNIPVKLGLLHYKFIPGDKEKYKERIKKGNFGKNSIQYKNYLYNNYEVSYKNIIKKLDKYENSSSLEHIDIIEKINWEKII